MELHWSSLERMGRLDMNFLKVAVSITGAARARWVRTVQLDWVEVINSN